jgi:hypothetical protein
MRLRQQGKCRSQCESFADFSAIEARCFCGARAAAKLRLVILY